MYTETHFTDAVLFNDITRVRQLHKANCPHRVDILNLGARIGSLEMTKFLYENDYYCDIDTFIAANKSGNYDVVYYLLNKRDFPKTVKVINAAIESGNLKLVQYIHDQEFQYDETAMRTAASIGNLEILLYLYNNKFPFDKNTVSCAIVSENLELISHLYVHSFPYDIDDIKGMVIRIKNYKFLQFVVNHYLRYGCYPPTPGVSTTPNTNEQHKTLISQIRDDVMNGQRID
jgi:hypothetical protein